MRRSALALVALLASACTGHDPAAPGSDGGRGDGAATDGATTGPCAAGAPRPARDQDLTLGFGGRPRAFHLHVPASYDGSPTALVLNFHGFTSSAAQQEIWTAMDAAADAVGYLVLYPDGTGTPRGWNAGGCCGQAVTDAVDDVGFAGALIDRARADLCVDPHRIYATGFSNGGFLANRLGCELADRIAAIAPVAGVLDVAACAPARPMPVLHFHGDADPVVPYLGSLALGFPSVAASIAGWVARDHCATQATTTFDQGDARCQSHGGCDGGAEVTLCTITGGGHTWPGGTVPGGYTSQDLDADAAMWTFFQAHPLP